MSEQEPEYGSPRYALGNYPDPPGRYERVGAEIGHLVDVKNKAYGKSFEHLGDLLLILYPHGIEPHQYHDLGAMIRILDKFFRIATKKDAFGEVPWTDVAGYAILMNKDYGEMNEDAKSISVGNAET
jgi:hypothetical protein